MVKKDAVYNLPDALVTKPNHFDLRESCENPGYKDKCYNIQREPLEDEKLQLKVDELHNINEKLLKQQKILERASEIHKKLTELVLNGRWFGAICSTLTGFTGCPVQIEDHNFNIKATTVHKTDTKLFLGGKDLMLNSDYSPQVKNLFQDKNPIEIVLDANTTQYLLPVVAGKQILGLISALFIHKKIKQLDMAALEQGAMLTALEMLKQSAIIKHTKRLKENFLENILEENYESKNWVRHRAWQLGFDLDNSYRIVVVKIEPHPKEKSKPELYEEIREFCMHSFPNIIVVTKGSHLLLMLVLEHHHEQHATGTVANLAVLLKEHLLQLVPEGTWWIALGAGYNELEYCVLAYRNALTTIDVMKTLKLKNKVAYFDNPGIFPLIEINPHYFTTFIQKTLGPLLAYDQNRKTQLINTLKLYFKHNGNVLKASRKGYLNLSTMKYRLRRIKEISGLDLKNAEVCFQLQLAMRLLNFDCPPA